MYSLKELQEIINKKIREEIKIIPKSPVELYRPVEYILLNEGKRIRPSLLLTACNLFSPDIDNAIFPALGIEIFHNFTLVHDDIMDKAPLRRGEETVHTKWNENTAILSGDTMLILAYQYLSNTIPVLIPEILSIFNTTAIGVCEGQQYDMNFESQDNVSLDDYIKMIKLKTSVLIAASLQIGAIIGGADKINALKLYNFGLNLGLAFQLKDDLLDIFGDKDVFGKQIGGDIVSNKKTYLYLTAISITTDSEKSELKDIFNDNRINVQEKIRIVTEIYSKLGIKEIAEREINLYYKNAIKELDEVKVSEKQKSILREIALKIMERNN